MSEYSDSNIPVSLLLRELILQEKFTSKVGQEVSFYSHKQLGRVLVINDEVQHVEAWKSLYHEPLVHTPIAFLQEPKTALILGGGSLFAAYELLKYDSLQKVVMIDHDEEVIDLMLRHYDHAKECLEDVRFNLDIYNFTDGIKNYGKFDLIINDAIDLYTEQENQIFPDAYSVITDLLSVHGVCSDVIYRHIFDKEILDGSLSSLPKKGNKVFGLITIPEYPGILQPGFSFVLSLSSSIY